VSTLLLRPLLVVRLFGERQLSFADQPLRFGAPVRALSLLAYLLLHREKELVRDSLAYTLWPDEREPDARANLRRHLYLLQNEVLPRNAGVQWIVTDARTVHWNPKAPLWLDVAEFERLLAEPATAHAAAELYHGDLLAGIEDEWIERRREQYRAQFCELLLRLAHARHARGDVSGGLEYVKILLHYDRWREDGLRLFMELRHQAGDRAGALREYQELARRLKDEIGAEPMPETVRLFQRITGDETPAALSTPGAKAGASNLPSRRTTLHGREQDIASVRTLLQKAQLVTLSGTGGVGKTRLAVAVARCLLDQFHGVRMVEFAAISDPALVVPTIAAALAVREREGRSLDECTIEALKNTSLLLVLDNCEHLVGAIAEFVDRVMRSTECARIVVTSREPLRVPGERVFRVQPLSVPDEPIGHSASIE
jgi:DNA-binding SARP family transcriptional activator